MQDRKGSVQIMVCTRCTLGSPGTGCQAAGGDGEVGEVGAGHGRAVLHPPSVVLARWSCFLLGPTRPLYQAIKNNGGGSI